MLEQKRATTVGGTITGYERFVMSEANDVMRLPAIRFLDADSNTSNGLEEQPHYTWDANGNITSMVDPAGNVIER